ncbi:MAG: phosphoenolpyruvate carboxykinase domain-containing protein, partial [Planctomycetota bacterium]
GVPISAILFGGRRASTFPLVFQSFDWKHGVFVGAGTGSETTAAQSGAVGVVRRDPMAMLPFCGYDMADYFGHWLAMGRRIATPPRIFHVNWFRTGSDGRFLWPGFGENLRVLRWVIERCRGKGEAVRTPIGWVPAEGGIDAGGLSMPPGAMRELLRVDREEWKAEIADIRAFFAKFGSRLATEMGAQADALERRFEGQ